MNTPFTTDQFLTVFEHYNQSIFPGQIFFLLLGILSLILTTYHIPSKNKIIGAIMGLMWAWIGAVYHIGFFAVINPVARIFGGLFILQGLLILYATFKNRLHFTLINKVSDYVGVFFVVFGIFIYPLIGVFIHQEPSLIISLGLPCPTALYTFGLFIMARNHFPNYLLIIPTLWALVGVSAAINFGVPQDFMLIIAAVAAIVLIYRDRKMSIKYESVG